jgi:single-stranded DNA-binding protein
MFNTSNVCIFEGRMTNNTKITQINGANGPVDKATFSISCPKALSSQQRQAAKNDPNIKQVDFINFQLIGAQVKTLQQYFPAGTPIKVFAHYTTWESINQQTGQKTYGHNFEVDYIGFVSTPAQNTGAAPQNNNGYQQAPQQNYQAPQNNGYQQAPQQNYQQAPQQQMPQGNFEMFPQEEYPF